MSLFRFRNSNRKSFFNSRNKQYDIIVEKIINKMFGQYIVINEDVSINKINQSFYIDNK